MLRRGAAAKRFCKLNLVDDDGNVKGGSKAKMRSLVDAYKELSGEIVIIFAKKAIEPLLTGKEDIPEELKS